MGKKKGKKNDNVPEVSGTAPQKTPVEGPSKGAPPSQPGSAPKPFSPSGKTSDGSQGGSGGPSLQRSSQGGPQGSASAQPQKSAWGQPPGKSSSHSGKAADGSQVGPGSQKPPQGGSGGHPSQKQPQAGGTPSKKHPQGSGGPPSQKQSQGSAGPAFQEQPQSSRGPPSQKQPQGSGGPPSQRHPQGSGGPPPYGAPSQAQKSAWGQQSGQQVAPAAQPYKGPQGSPAGQHPKDAQGSPKGQKKGPQKGTSQGPSAERPFVAAPATHSRADDPQKKASGQPLKSQSGKENVPPKQREEKPTASQKVEGKRDKFPQLDQPLKEIPRREAEGTLGRKIKLQVNLLPLNFDNLCPEIIHYDVAFDPERPKRLLRSALDVFREKHFRLFSVAFDGRKNLYSARRLPFGNRIEETVIVQNPERSSNNEIEFKIQIQYAQSIDTNLIKRFFNQRTNRAELLDTPQTAIQAIDVVLRTALSRTALVPVGRSYFLPTSDPFNLGGGLDLWHGFYQSAILNWKPFLNVDVAHKGFPKPILLIDLLKDVCGLQDLYQRLRDDQIRKFKGFITTLKVAYEVKTVLNSRRIYRVNGLGRSAREHTFESNGSRMSVKDYYRREKRYELKYPDLPTVQVDPAQKGIYLPLELCTLLEGQAVNRKLDQYQTREMIREAAKPPLDRKERIMTAIRAAKYNESRVVNEFGIGVSNNFAEVPARVLPPPSIVYKDERSLDPSGGQWATGLFLSSKELKKWVILNLDYRTQPSTLNRFSGELINQARRQGMTINEVMDIKNLDTRQLQPALRNLMTDWKEKKVELVLVVLPMTSDTYGKVKQTAELQVGILTQCVKCQTLKNERNFSSSCENLVKKINAKTNGINHQLGGGANRPWPRVLHAALAEPIMFVGIDVTHPSPDQKDIPSVAAVSASHDREALFKYNMIWRLQPPRVEIIQDLKNIFKEHLKVFYTKTGHKPRKIIVYRDGVSEGQFRQVLTYELMAIRQACIELQSDYKPGITFLVVQKRHHVRFFPTNPKEADRKGNVLPGTIVDTEITHPRELDFYLASHASLQGTSRPTKYHRLWDDNDISEDDLEVLTYYLCHLFSRCNRSVSYPAPTYYAHLAAYRARVYLENNHLNLNEPDALQKFQQRNQINPDFRSASPMFFV